MNSILRGVGNTIARFLDQPSPNYAPLATSDPQRLRQALRPCDVLLVEGNRRISVAIKYLTQSTWSHAALYAGELPCGNAGAAVPMLIEADLIEGVRLIELSEYVQCHTRICRPVGLTDTEREKILESAKARIGEVYDLKNVIDLARYLLPTPPVPVRWRRRMLALGSGEPTRAICSTLIAQLFQSVGYPILPHVEKRPAPSPGCDDCTEEILHIRHHSLFAPRDFDISPYFSIVKPALESGFDFHEIKWEATASSANPDALVSEQHAHRQISL